MSNAGRPRTNLKACPFDGATERDSNGQCHCRNVLYREVRKAPQQKAKIQKTYDGLLKDGEGVVGALAGARAAVPALAAASRKPAATKAPAKKATKKAATSKPVKEKAEKPAPAAKAEKPAPDRYVLHIEDGFTDPKGYARKDAAVKNGVRSGESWKVMLKGKTVAASDDLL